MTSKLRPPQYEAAFLFQGRRVEWWPELEQREFMPSEETRENLEREINAAKRRFAAYLSTPRPQSMSVSVDLENMYRYQHAIDALCMRYVKAGRSGL